MSSATAPGPEVLTDAGQHVERVFDSSHDSPQRQEPRLAIVVPLLTVATLLGLAVRLFRLDHPVLWLDELATYLYTLQSWDRLLGELKFIDVHPPYYYALQKAWAVFGDSRTALRTFPVVLGTACIPLLFVLGRRLLGTRAGLIAAFLLVTAPMHVYYSRELRMYSLLNLSALIALVGLAYAIPIRGRARPLIGWSCYVIGALSAFYAQTSAALLPVLAFAFVALLTVTGRVERRVLYQCVLAHGVLLISVAPWLLALFHHVSDTLADFWIPQPSFGWAKSQILGTYPYPIWLKPLFYGAFLAGLWKLRTRLVPAMMICVFAVGQPVLMWALSYLRPVMIVRAMIWPTALTLLLPAALFARWKRVPMVLATGAFVVLQVFALQPYFPAERQVPDVQRLVPALGQFNPATDMLVLEQQSMEFEFRFVAPQPLRPAHVLGMTNGDKTQLLEPLLISRHIARDRLDEETAGKRVWLVSELHPRFEADVKPAVQQLLASRRELRRWTSGNFTLVLLER